MLVIICRREKWTFLWIWIYSFGKRAAMQLVLELLGVDCNPPLCGWPPGVHPLTHQCRVLWLAEQGKTPFVPARVPAEVLRMNTSAGFLSLRT